MTGSFTEVKLRGVLVARVPWPEVQARLDAGAIAMLPVGAACKEHGYHLPMNTDFLQAEWLAFSMAELAEVAVWPTLSYGYYPAFIDYPGSCSLSRATFISAVYEILVDIVRAGASSVVILNTGISTITPLKEAIASHSHVQLINCYQGPHYQAVVRELQEQPRGGHADELETSIMLAIAPEQVHMARAEACTNGTIRGPFNRTNPKAANYSPSGVYGDPRLATRAKGERLVRAILRDILEVLEGLRCQA
jgi:creatinine amidohydrolase